MMNLPSDALLVVAKRPAPGHTKARLSPPLSPAQAAALYECFLLDTLEVMRRVIAYLPRDARDYFATLAPDFDLIPQEGGDLSARLDQALVRQLRLGYARVAIMNSDGLTLPAKHLQQAFEVLSDHTDVVLGPSEDGGY